MILKRRYFCLILVGCLLGSSGSTLVPQAPRPYGSAGPDRATAADNVGEFIYETAPFPSAHASTIVELPNGDLLAAWFGGTEESNPDVAIWGSRKSGGKWSAPAELVRERGTPCWNPVYFYTNDKRLWLYYKYGTRPTFWSAGRRYSDDDGKTW